MLRKKINYIAFASIALSSYATSSFAGLYVYPVSNGEAIERPALSSDTRNVGYHSPDSSSRYVIESDSREMTPHDFYKSVQNSSRGSDRTINLSQEYERAIPCYGKNVPLDIAMSEVASGLYKVNYSSGVSGKRVSWSFTQDECKSIDMVLSGIARKNNLGIHINEEEGYIGVASNDEEAYFFSFENPQVWHSDPTLSITENLNKWAESIGWKVEWPEIMNEIDFESSETFLYGEFIGEGGVFHKVVSQISKRNPDILLSVKFYKNKHIVVEEGGYVSNIKEGDKI